MKKTIYLIIFLIGITANGQKKTPSGDEYFFAHDYANAIEQYEILQRNNTINVPQCLNLADAYFRIKNYEKSAEAFVNVFEKDTVDNVMSDFHFNKMLQALSKSTRRAETGAYLEKKASSLDKHLLENADFNYELLNSPKNDNSNYQIFNLKANSSHSDFSPSFYKDKLLFTSARSNYAKPTYKPLYKTTTQSFLDIFEGDLQDDGQLSNVARFEELEESPFHKATPFYAESLSSFLYVLSNSKRGELTFDENGKNALAVAKQVQGGPFTLLLKDLSTSFYYPFYDALSGRLYFAADFKDEGFGGTDIYYVYTNNGQIMSAPINLGPRINTPGNEIAPFIFENSLYFSSDVFYGLGGMDIYKTNIEDVSDYSIPVNLGVGINTPQDDFGFVMRNHGEGLIGYFSSNRPGGAGDDDIYGFMVDEKPGLKTLALKGKIIKPYGDYASVPNALVELYDSEGTLLKDVYSDENGNYRIEIPWTDQITVTSSKSRFSTYSNTLDETQIEQFQDANLDITLSEYDDLVERKENQTVIKMDDFFFGKGRTDITAVAPYLDKVVAFVQDFPSVQLRIEAHTDSRGGTSTNFNFTQKRADAIKRYLMSKGVPATNILYAVGFGEQKIINNCKNGVFCLEMLHKQNQRTLFVVLNDNILFN